jgi:stage II sporulation protein AA (anti-sigma F factor antagonist)
MHPTSLEIARRVVDGVTILDLKGRLILHEGELVFRQKVDELIQQGQTRLLVNFNDVTYLDSAGVGAVVWKYVTLRRQGGSLKLLNLRPRSHRVLKITHLLNVLEAFDSEQDAIRSFSSLS